MTCKMTLNAFLNWASWLVVCDFLIRLVWVGTGRSFPKLAELLAEKRDDVLAAVREQGGVVAVAKRMGLRP